MRDEGGMRGEGEACVEKGVCVAKRACMAKGRHVCHTPRTPRDTVGQCAAGTHPTGMHFCYTQLFFERQHLLTLTNKVAGE